MGELEDQMEHPVGAPAVRGEAHWRAEIGV